MSPRIPVPAARALAGAGALAGRARRAVASRARPARRTAARTAPVPVDLLLDGAALLNWRLPGAEAEAIELVPVALPVRAGAPVPSVPGPRAPGGGPAHGTVRLDALDADRYRVLVRRAGAALPGVATGRGEGTGTRNLARTEDGSCWGLEQAEDGGTHLVRRPAAEVAPGIVSLRALHGMLELSVAPAPPGSRLRLERRGARDGVEADPAPALRPAAGDGASAAALRYRIGAPQWERIAALVEADGQDRTVLNVHLLPPGDGSAPDARPHRLGWTGSPLEDPRERLRYRATTSWAVAGRSIAIRPYWTTDQYLAVEVHVQPTSEGNAA